MARPDDLNALWVGPRLRPLEQVCILSMLRQGHRVRLFSYGPVEGVPEGVELADAAAILPPERLIRHRGTGSPSLGSNVFRYELMQHEMGTWVDLDVLMLKPLPQVEGHLFGRQGATTINTAVLRIPPQSPLLAALLDFVAQPAPIPPFFRRYRRNWLALRHALGVPQRVEAMRWGVFGPKALSHFATATGTDRFALPREVFYPVGSKEAHGPFIAGWDVAARLTPATVAVHLWNEALRHPSALRPANPRGRLLVEPGSFVERFAREELGFRLASE